MLQSIDLFEWYGDSVKIDKKWLSIWELTSCD